MSVLEFTQIVSRPASNEECQPEPGSAGRFSHRLTRSQIVDAATRLIARRGDHRIPWPTIALEAGGEPFGAAPDWLEDHSDLIASAMRARRRRSPTACCAPRPRPAPPSTSSRPFWLPRSRRDASSGPCFPSAADATCRTRCSGDCMSGT